MMMHTRAALNSEISQCIQELKMLQAERGWAVQGARKMKPADYIAGMIESFGERRVKYQQSTRIDDFFREVLFPKLWRANELAEGNENRTNTNERFHATDDLWFIQKVKQQLDLITPFIAIPEFNPLITEIKTALDDLSARIQDWRHTQQGHRDAAAQAAANGEDNDDD